MVIARSAVKRSDEATSQADGLVPCAPTIRSSPERAFYNSDGFQPIGFFCRNNPQKCLATHTLITQPLIKFVLKSQPWQKDQ